MKKLLLLSALSLALTGCGADAPAVDEPEHTNYITTGRYYFNADLQGQVVTSDGNVWGYTQDIISEQPSYHNEPVYAVFDDNGTPDNIYDDIIEGLVLDRETAIYDAFEAEFSKDGNFTVERDGNNIRIGVLEIAE